MNTPAKQIVRALRGDWYGSSGMARCPVHADRVPSLAISYKDGRVLLHCHAGCDPRAVVYALRRLGLWPARSAEASAFDASVTERSDHPRVAQGSKRKIACEIWQAAGRSDTSPLDSYVRHRGITVPVPASLRFSPRLFHAPTEQHLPAIVAAVQDSENVISAVQRVFVKKDGRGKADVRPNKMCLGALGDGAVRLAPAGEITGLCEGWETGLSAAQLFGLPLWCALGASRMHRVAFPAFVHAVVIFADNDHAGHVAAERAAEVHQLSGRSVEVRLPSNGSDFNDELVLTRQQ